MNLNTNNLVEIQNSKLGIGLDNQFTESDEDINFLLTNIEVGNTAKAYTSGLLNFIKFIKEDQQEKNYTIKNIVELNCYQGELTCMFAKHFSPEQLFVVDKFDKIDSTWPKSINLEDVKNNFNIRTEKYPFIKVINKNITEAASDFDNQSVDLLYINDHVSYEDYNIILNKWICKVKTNGYICGNYWGNGDIVKSVIEKIGEPEMYFTDSSWVRIKMWEED